MLRRLIHFLAARQIREAEEGARAIADLDHAIVLHFAKRASYLQGHQQGVVDALAEVERQVVARLGDMVLPEDVAAVRKRSIH